MRPGSLRCGCATSRCADVGLISQVVAGRWDLPTLSAPGGRTFPLIGGAGPEADCCWMGGAQWANFTGAWRGVASTPKHDLANRTGRARGFLVEHRGWSCFSAAARIASGTEAPGRMRLMCVPHARPRKGMASPGRGCLARRGRGHSSCRARLEGRTCPGRPGTDVPTTSSWQLPTSSQGGRQGPALCLGWRSCLPTICLLQASCGRCESLCRQSQVWLEWQPVIPIAHHHAPGRMLRVRASPWRQYHSADREACRSRVETLGKISCVFSKKRDEPREASGSWGGYDDANDTQTPT